MPESAMSSADDAAHVAQAFKSVCQVDLLEGCIDSRRKRRGAGEEVFHCIIDSSFALSVVVGWNFSLILGSLNVNVRYGNGISMLAWSSARLIAATTSSRLRRMSIGFEPVHQATSKLMLELANSCANTSTVRFPRTDSHETTPCRMTSRDSSTSSA